jgi:hypothetical protein
MNLLRDLNDFLRFIERLKFILKSTLINLKIVNNNNNNKNYNNNIIKFKEY